MPRIFRVHFQEPALASDRSVRLLGALGGASTSRVLNLLKIAQDNATNPEHGDKPLFLSSAINRAFIIKHRTRSDESYLFPSPQSSTTKIITPFDETDLRAGGRSIFIDQRGYREALRQMGIYQTDERLDRDFAVLRLLNVIPSLDPFLLREHLRNHDIDVAPCYFAISVGAQAGITVVSLSSGAEGATTARGGDIVVWTSGTGLFGGLAFNGSVISPDKDWNASANPAAPTRALRANLASVR